MMWAGDYEQINNYDRPYLINKPVIKFDYNL